MYVYLKTLRIYFLLFLVIHGFKHIHLNANLAQVLTLDAGPICEARVLHGWCRQVLAWE